ncbi:hypothetical protein B0H19DRAFT_1384897 [Mycena capillaripes]|nr:hypothetical protein B0H19DRAFT_1384897 [Mycena capillaripes]
MNIVGDPPRTQQLHRPFRPHLGRRPQYPNVVASVIAALREAGISHFAYISSASIYDPLRYGADKCAVSLPRWPPGSLRAGVIVSPYENTGLLLWWLVRMARGAVLSHRLDHTLSNLSTYLNQYVRADIISLAFLFAVATCSGPVIPFRGGAHVPDSGDSLSFGTYHLLNIVEAG